ncbi:MAG: ATP-dependent RNA helicase DbpA [bacterium]
MTESFELLGLPQSWIQNLDQLGYVRMTPIQAQALPKMLAGQDVIGLASTGTGKTAAFGLALLKRITPASQRPGALVLCPTRELAAQVADEIRRLARPLANTNVVVLTGGTSFGRQRASLENGVDVVVGTPGRVLDHLRRETLDLSLVKTLVLDEADRMLDMGFVEDVQSVVDQCAASRLTLLFSATMHEDVTALSATLQDNPELVAVEAAQAPDITQMLYEIGPMDRFDALVRVLGYHQPDSAVVFCNQRETVDDVTARLADLGFSVRRIHGGMEQRDRDDVLLMFSNASVRVLVATNVAARGIDIDELDAVINYELPRDTKEFVHRVGRTGRAGESGLAISLCARNDQRRIENIPLLADVNARPVSKLPERSIDPLPARMRTLVLQGGRKDKIRAGDIVGALTGELGLEVDSIGAIGIGDRVSHVAIERDVAGKALARINSGKIKGRNIKARYL